MRMSRLLANWIFLNPVLIQVKIIFVYVYANTKYISISNLQAQFKFMTLKYPLYFLNKYINIEKCMNK